jgi:hypothetical protein
MKRVKLITVLLIALSLITLGGCNIVAAKRLIVSNTSSSVTITGVQVRQYVGSRIISFEDMMDAGEAIAPGESKTFHIAPSTSARGTELTVEYASFSCKSVGFTYDYQVNHINSPVTVSFDGTDFTVSGSNAVILQDS